MIWIFSTEVKEERRCCRRSQTFGKRNCFGWLYKSCWVSDTDALLLIISNQRRIRLQIYLSKSVFCCFIYLLLCRFWSSGADGLLSATCRAQIVVGGTMSWDHRAVITVRQRELHQRPRSAFFYLFFIGNQTKNTNSNSRKIAEHQIWSSVCHKHQIRRHLHLSFQDIKVTILQILMKSHRIFNIADGPHLYNVWSFNDFHTGFPIQAPS